MVDNKVGNHHMFLLMFIFHIFTIMQILSLSCCARNFANLESPKWRPQINTFVLCSNVDLWFKTLKFPNENNMSRLSRFKLYWISMFWISDFRFSFVYSHKTLRELRFYKTFWCPPRIRSLHNFLAFPLLKEGLWQNKTNKQIIIIILFIVFLLRILNMPFS